MKRKEPDGAVPLVQRVYVLMVNDYPVAVYAKLAKAQAERAKRHAPDEGRYAHYHDLPLE